MKQNRNGEYLSTKHKGYGIGIISVKEIAERYHSSVQIERKDNVFMVSVLLN